MKAEFQSPEYFLEMLKPLSSKKLAQANIMLHDTTEFKSIGYGQAWVENIKRSRWYGPFVKEMRSDRVFFFVSHNGEENSESATLKICKNGAEIRLNFYDNGGGILRNTVFYNI